MIKAFPVLIVLVAMACLPVGMDATPAWAFEFSADRILKKDGKTVRSSVKAKGDRWRFEYAQPQAWAQACIVRQDLRFAWLILSPRRLYVEVPIAPDHRLLVVEKIDGEIARELIGTQDLHGYPTELFEVTAVVKGERMQFYQWVTTAERFAIKTVSKRGAWSLEYRNLKFLPQWERLFDPPRGFFKGRGLKSGF